ncbi:Ca2+-binding RTX toxin-like protein [Rhodoblastus acidophilus]|nr:M10 family metallopeptidase C-terminal domain-containing protein [Rhodoblastus acidophilus]MCW2274718.1 Ca2+-binding RTX toxin-like protein [Rhodoblastus acidophilus]
MLKHQRTLNSRADNSAALQDDDAMSAGVDFGSVAIGGVIPFGALSNLRQDQGLSLAAASPSSLVTPQAAVFASVSTLATYLVSGYWGGSPKNYYAPGATITVNMTDLSAAEQHFAVVADRLWHDVCNINFTYTTGSADITYNNNGSGKAFTSGDGHTIDISTDWEDGPGAGDYSYFMQTYIHETGHALGLGHQGPYNGSATYGVDNIYTNDTWRWSIMSYFGQSNYGSDSYDYVIAPQMADILAVQTIYGARTNTRTGNTTYGFNATSDAGSFYNFSTYSGTPAFTIYDSGGVDTLDASGYSYNQTLNLTGGSWSSIGGYTNNIAIYTTTTVENADGGSGDDTITGNAANNVIYGNAGIDTISGNDGNDTIYGGDGNDKLYGNNGNDYISGGAGNNIIDGGAGNNSLYGGVGNDTIVSGAGADTINAGDGTNSVNAGDGANIITTGSGADVIVSGAGVDTISSGSGNDVITAGSGSDTVNAGDGNDRVVDTDLINFDNYNGGLGVDIIDYSNDTFAAGVVTINLATGSAFVSGGNSETLTGFENVSGSQGGETIIGNSVANSLSGNGGDDNVQGGAGNDYLYGGSGNDALSGDTGDDHIYGQSGDNSLYGGDGNDSLYGDVGNDTVYGGAGTDVMNGGAGVNTLSYSLDAGVTVNLSVTTGQDTGGAGVDTQTNFQNLTGSFFNDTLTGNAGDNVLKGGGGADILNGGDGNDTLFAGDPNLVDYKPADVHNSTMEAAVDVFRMFGLQSADIIDNPTTTPHATVRATGSGDPEYYQFIAGAGATGVFDIDQTSSGLDTSIRLLDHTGAIIASNDDRGTFDPGSYSTYDSYLSYTFTSTDFYYIEVLKYGGVGVPVGTKYTLNLSVSGSPTTAVAAGSTLNGGAGNDSLYGASGDDVLDGGSGVDAMSGGAGNDTYYVDNTADTVTETSIKGVDVVYASASFTLAAGQAVEILRANAGSTALTLSGNELANAIYGGGGGDTIDGGAGADAMYGGAGSDWYSVENVNDQVVENAGEGTDTLSTTFNVYVLPANVENLVFSGSGNFIGTGNALDNVIKGGGGSDVLNGGDGNDTLNGLAGIDTMIGGSGDDTYFVDIASDTVTEAVGGGADTVKASVSYTLKSGQEIESLVANAGSTGLALSGNESNNTITGGGGNDTLNGAAGNDALNGGDGNDVLNGGLGVDAIAGGTGNDTYYVDNVGDTIAEAVGGGTDTVYASISYALLAGQEVEYLRANAGATGLALNGNELANTIYGGAGADTLKGGAGNDVLNGLAGADAMAGEAGNDTYFVDNAGDIVTEAVGGGVDTVYASVSYTLLSGQEIESLLSNAGATGVTLTGNEFANTLTGGSGIDKLYGGAGNDILSGLAGADAMEGGTGNDIYRVDNSSDTVTEAARGGVDTVYASVSYQLQSGQEVENLRANAGATGLTLVGNDLNNAIYGGTGADTLKGAGGTDGLAGGAGADSLTGGAGKDSFRFDTALGASNIDTVVDFTIADDSMLLASAIFTQAGPVGVLGADAFVIGAAALDATDRIIYNSTTGAMFYDPDGLGGLAATQFATLSTSLAVTNTSFQVV